MSKTKSDMSSLDIDRYIDWCRQYGVTEAQRLQQKVVKLKKTFKKLQEVKNHVNQK